MRRALFLSLLSHGVLAAGVAGAWLWGGFSPPARSAAIGQWLVVDSGSGNSGPGGAASVQRVRNRQAGARELDPVQASAGAGSSESAGGQRSGSQVSGSRGSGSDSSLELSGDLLPDYPALSRRLHEEGEVVVEVSVGAATGAVKDVRLVRSSGHARLDQAALRYLEEARYRVPPSSQDATFRRVFTLRYSLSAAEPGLAAASP